MFGEPGLRQRCVANRQALWWWAVVCLLLIAISRGRSADLARFNHDEVRSISSALGTPAQIIAAQPPDWPPLYFLFLSAWRYFIGMNPFLLRYTGVLFFLLANAGVYLLARTLFNRAAALPSMLAFSALGLNIFLSTSLRPYTMSFALYPLAFWCGWRYFSGLRWREGVGFAALLALMFYTAYTAPIAFAVMGVILLVNFPRRWWAWLPIGGLAVLFALPQLLDLFGTSYALNRANVSADVPLNPAGDGLLGYWWFRYVAFFGHVAPVWMLIVILAIGWAVWKERKPTPTTVTLIAIVAGMPLFIATLGTGMGFAESRYWWGISLAFALLIGYGWSFAPRVLQVGLGAFCVGVMFVHIPEGKFSYGLGELPTHFEDAFTVLAQQWQGGDVLILDERCKGNPEYERPFCGYPEEWDYYQMTYFPNGGLTLTDSPSNHRRVWFFHNQNGVEARQLQAVQDGRLPSVFVGPPTFLFQLYVAPPNSVGIGYANGLRFHGYEIIDPLLNNQVNDGVLVRREGESIRIRLWWSVDEPLTADYSTALHIATDITQPAIISVDGIPQPVSLQPNVTSSQRGETSTWMPNTFYVDERVLSIPSDVSLKYMLSDLQLYLTVYQWWDGQTIPNAHTHDNGRMLLRPMRLLAY